MCDKIDNEYIYSKEESEIIKKYFNNYEDWKKDVFSTIKKNIITHLRIQQKNKCCYCKKKLGFDLKEVDIEHILPKSIFSSFTFIPKNLALSCPACNTIKGRKNVAKRTFTRYPSTGNNILIVHPYFDKYSDHINIINNSVYAAITEKGSETITICKLFRLQEVENRTRINQDSCSLSKLVESIRTAPKEEVDSFIDIIKKIINT